MQLLILNPKNSKWKQVMRTCKNCICIDENSLHNYNKQYYKLLPIYIHEYVKYNNLENNVFKNGIDNIHLCNNKSKFTKYMLQKFPIHIPKTYYYHFDNETFLNMDPILSERNKLILKPNEDMGGNGIRVIYTFERNVKPNSIIQEYIDHDEYFVGHFLVFHGKIHTRVYFKSSEINKNGIKCGAIQNYIDLRILPIDDSIFSAIFSDLSYSGIADIDFIIYDNKIIIFEINPRPGGSLLTDDKYFNLFTEELLKYIHP